MPWFGANFLKKVDHDQTFKRPYKPINTGTNRAPFEIAESYREPKSYVESLKLKNKGEKFNFLKKQGRRKPYKPELCHMTSTTFVKVTDEDYEREEEMRKKRIAAYKKDFMPPHGQKVEKKKPEKKKPKKKKKRKKDDRPKIEQNTDFVKKLCGLEPDADLETEVTKDQVKGMFKHLKFDAMDQENKAKDVMGGTEACPLQTIVDNWKAKLERILPTEGQSDFLFSLFFPKKGRIHVKNLKDFFETMHNQVMQLADVQALFVNYVPKKKDDSMDDFHFHCMLWNYLIGGKVNRDELVNGLKGKFAKRWKVDYDNDL